MYERLDTINVAVEVMLPRSTDSHSGSIRRASQGGQRSTSSAPTEN